MKTKLHYIDVLSVIDGRLCGEMDGVYRVCDAVAGPGVTTLALSFLAQPVKEEILRQHPKLRERLSAIRSALDETFEDFGKIKRKAPKTSTKPFLDKYVLRLLPSEYFEIDHLSKEEMDKLGPQYSKHLEKVLADKEVIVVVTK